MKNILINDERIMSVVYDACKILDKQIEEHNVHGNKLNGFYITVQDLIDLIPVLVEEIGYKNKEIDGLQSDIEDMECEIENLKDHLKFLSTPFGEDEDYDECQWED